MALRINPLDSTVWLKQTHYVNALLTPAGLAEPAATPSVAAKSIIAADVEDLDVDTIVALLEEYYRRAIRDGTPPLMPPGKVTLMPLIRGKMRHASGAG